MDTNFETEDVTSSNENVKGANNASQPSTAQQGSDPTADQRLTLVEELYKLYNSTKDVREKEAQYVAGIARDLFANDAQLERQFKDQFGSDFVTIAKSVGSAAYPQGFLKTTIDDIISKYGGLKEAGKIVVELINSGNLASDITYDFKQYEGNLIVASEDGLTVNEVTSCTTQWLYSTFSSLYNSSEELRSIVDGLIEPKLGVKFSDLYFDNLDSIASSALPIIGKIVETWAKGELSMITTQTSTTKDSTGIAEFMLTVLWNVLPDVSKEKLISQLELISPVITWNYYYGLNALGALAGCLGFAVDSVQKAITANTKNGLINSDTYKQVLDQDGVMWSVITIGPLTIALANQISPSMSTAVRYQFNKYMATTQKATVNKIADIVTKFSKELFSKVVPYAIGTAASEYASTNISNMIDSILKSENRVLDQFVSSIIEAVPTITKKVVNKAALTLATFIIGGLIKLGSSLAKPKDDQQTDKEEETPQTERQMQPDPVEIEVGPFNPIYDYSSWDPGHPEDAGFEDVLGDSKTNSIPIPQPKVPEQKDTRPVTTPLKDGESVPTALPSPDQYYGLIKRKKGSLQADGTNTWLANAPIYFGESPVQPGSRYK